MTGKILKGSIYFALGLFLTLIVLELYLRAGEILLPSTTVLDARVGSTLKPEAEMVLIKDGLYIGAVNALGYLGPAYPKERTEGTIRIALIGDSYVEGLHVFDRHHFRAVLERELRSRTGNDVEVLNFGRSGFHLSDMYCYDVNVVSEYRPDIVLYFIHRASMNIIERPLGPYCYLDGDSLKINYEFATSPEFAGRQRSGWMRGRSSILAMASNCAINASRGLAWSIIFDKFYFGTLPGAVPGNRESTTPAEPFTPVDRAILARLSEHNAITGNARVAIVNMGVTEEVEGFIRSSHLDLVDPAPALKELEARGINPHYWKATRKMGHWNHHANIAVGEFLAGVIQPWIDHHERPAK